MAMGPAIYKPRERLMTEQLQHAFQSTQRLMTECQEERDWTEEEPRRWSKTFTCGFKAPKA
jgi:hypothetical protein